MTLITSYTQLDSPASDDVLVIVDIDDDTQSSQGTTKQITVADLIATGGVFSVNSLTGTVTLTAASVSALPTAGGTMSGPIAMGASKITGLANGSATQDAAAYGQLVTVLGQSENPLGIAPTGATGETCSRTLATGTSAATGSGTVYVVAIALPAGVAVNHITLFTSATAVTQADLTHGWYALLDSTLTVRAVSSDQIDVAFLTVANTGYTLSVAGSAYTTTYSGLYYIAVSVSTSAGSQPTFQARASTGTNGAAAAAPILQGTAGTQAAPPLAGAQLNSGTVAYVNSNNFYAYTS